MKLKNLSKLRRRVLRAFRVRRTAGRIAGRFADCSDIGKRVGYVKLFYGERLPTPSR